MKQLNNNTSVFKPLENKSTKKANEVFIKLLVDQRKPKNPFDEIRSQTWNPHNQTKQGVDSSDTN